MDQIKQINDDDMLDTSNYVQQMFTDAATMDSEEPQVEIVNKPFHFDLLGLA